MAPFASNAEYAQALIGVITQRCAAAVRTHAAQGLIADPDAIGPLVAAIGDISELAGRAAVLDARLAVSTNIALADAFEAWRLETVDRTILATLLAADCSPQVFRLMTSLGGGMAAVAAMLAPGPAGMLALAARLAPDAPLIRLALLTVRDPDRPLPARRLEPAPRLLALLAGTHALDPQVTGALLQREREVRVASWTADAAREPLRAAIAEGCALPIVELAGDGSAALAADVALTLGWAALRVTTTGDAAWLDALAREALLHHAAIIVDGAAPEALLQRFAALPIPVIAAHVETALPVRRLVLALPDVAKREALWAAALDGAPHDVELAQIARVARVGPEAIERAAKHAFLSAFHIHHRDLLTALLAQLGPLPVTDSTARWDDLVLPGGALDRVRDFLAAVREQRLADGALGERARLTISGPAGSGKSTLAGLIARELLVPLLEVEAPTPAAIVAAERGLVLLASHTDVAVRAPVLYIRREAEDALVLAALTPDARAKLWRLALSGIPQTADLGFDELAREHALTGGQIRAIARRARQIATETDKPVHRALVRELARRTQGGNLA